MRLRLLTIILAGLALGGLAALAVVPNATDRLAALAKVRTIGKATVGGPFDLIDHTGRPATDQDFRGRHMLVLFGFTFCPDVCPSGLQVMAAALDKLGARGARIVPLFITLDPERDTPQQLAQYVASFHPRLIGLTGTPQQIQAAASAYRVYFKKVKDEKSSADYTIDHTSIIYLMGPDGAFVTHFSHATAVDAMAERLAKAL